MRPGSTGRATAEVDPRVGGRFRIVMYHPSSKTGTEHTGEYLLIDRPRRLSFTWRSIHTHDSETTVTIELFDRDGATEVVLIHAQLPSTELDNHREGWTDILSALGEC